MWVLRHGHVGFLSFCFVLQRIKQSRITVSGVIISRQNTKHIDRRIGYHPTRKANGARLFPETRKKQLHTQKQIPYTDRCDAPGMRSEYYDDTGDV